MPDTEIEHMGAVLELRCPNRHIVGHLLANRASGVIDYMPERRRSHPWTRHVEGGLFSLPVCPRGCECEVGESAERLATKMNDLANDNSADEDSYQLTFIGPATPS
jgi:hypothetical protein